MNMTRNMFLKSTALALVTSFVLVTTHGGAFAQSTRDLQNRINQLENQIQTLSRAMFRDGANPIADSSAAASKNLTVTGGNVSADFEVRLSQLETEIRTLTGRVEEVGFQTRQIQEQLQKALMDYDTRLGDLERTGAQSSMPMPERNNMPVSPGNGDGPMSSSAVVSPNSAAANNGANIMGTSETAPVLPVETSGMKQNMLGTLRTPVGPDGQPLDGGDALTPSPDDSVLKDANPTQLYETAFSQLRAGDYLKAEKSFREFLGAYPNDALYGNAQYWLGETYYVRNNFEQAARTFAQGYQRDPKGAKAADNLLKLSLSLANMGKATDACLALSQLEKEFKDEGGSVLRRADKEKQRLGCSQ